MWRLKDLQADFARVGVVLAHGVHIVHGGIQHVGHGHQAGILVGGIDLLHHLFHVDGNLVAAGLLQPARDAAGIEVLLAQGRVVQQQAGQLGGRPGHLVLGRIEDHVELRIGLLRPGGIQALARGPATDVVEGGAVAHLESRQGADERGHVGRQSVRHRQGLVQLRAEQLRLVGRQPGLAHPEAEQGHAQGEVVALHAHLGRLAGHIGIELRRGVDGRTHLVNAARAARRAFHRDAEVGQHDLRPLAVGIEEVSGLDVAVQDAVLRQEVDGGTHAYGHLGQGFLIALQHDAVQRTAFAVVHQFVIVPFARTVGMLPFAVADDIYQQAAALQLVYLLQDDVVGPVVRVVIVELEDVFPSVAADGENQRLAGRVGQDALIAVVHPVQAEHGGPALHRCGLGIAGKLLAQSAVVFLLEGAQVVFRGRWCAAPCGTPGGVYIVPTGTGGTSGGVHVRIVGVRIPAPAGAYGLIVWHSFPVLCFK